MKQWITEKQFNELTEEQKSDWYQFCRKNGYVIYDYGGNDFKTRDFPSIGEMIEFIDAVDENASPLDISRQLQASTQNKIGWCVYFNGNHFADSLEDALWEVVKEILGNKKQPIEIEKQ